VKSFAFVCLAVVVSTSRGRADLITVDAFNNNTPATVSFNDGAGHSGTMSENLTQFNVTFTGSSTTVTFDTFSVDLLHTATVGQTYSVTPRSDLATAFTNGSRIAFIYQNFGTQDLTSNPNQAAAVQLAVWDLSLNNHNPTFFVMGNGGIYSSGDPSVFSVTFGGSVDAAQIASLVNGYLGASIGAPTQGGWLDASVSGGESVLQQVPEPASLVLGIAAAFCFSIWGLRRHAGWLLL